MIEGVWAECGERGPERDVSGVFLATLGFFEKLPAEGQPVSQGADLAQGPLGFAYPPPVGD